MNSFEKKSPSLRELQVWMRWVLTDPRGVEPALRSEGSLIEVAKEETEESVLSRYIEPKPRALALIAANHSEDDAEKISRLNVYAEGYFSRLLESLSLDFPKTKHLIGEELFAKLIGDYLKRYPSRTRNIGEVGARLPEFASTYFFSESFPWLSDLLQLERHECLCFFAHSAPTFDPGILERLTDEKSASLRVILHPSIFIQASKYRLDEAEDLEPGEDLREEGSYFAIYRAESMDDQVRIEVLTEFEYEILSGCIAGKRLLDVFTEGEDRFESEKDLSSLFSRWMERGWISALEF